MNEHALWDPNNQILATPAQSFPELTLAFPRNHCGRECVYVWTGENATSGRKFFWKRREKVAFSNECGYVWTGLQLLVMYTIPVVSAQCLLYINESELRFMHLIVKNTFFFMHNAYFILTNRSTEPLGKSEPRVKGNQGDFHFFGTKWRHLLIKSIFTRSLG